MNKLLLFAFMFSSCIATKQQEPIKAPGKEPTKASVKESIKEPIKETQPIYHAGEKVKIIDGFYKGCTGFTVTTGSSSRGRDYGVQDLVCDKYQYDYIDSILEKDLEMNR